MKLSYRDIDGFLKSPNPAAKAILVYGPDEGLVRERMALLGKTVVDDLNDTFNVVDLNGDQIDADPALLSDEAFSLSMMGGRRLIRIRGADKNLDKILKPLLEQADKIEHLILIAGGDLPPKSGLRKLCETSKAAAALPCYVEDERDVTKFLTRFFIDNGKTIAPDAVTLAAGILTGDRALIRQEAEKILIYKGDDPAPISINDIRACLGESNAETLDALMRHIASGRLSEMENNLNFLFSEGANAVMVLRITQNYFRRLYITQARLKEMSFEQAAAKLQPPLFFKNKPDFQRHLRQWTLPRLKGALSQLQTAEAHIKRGDTIPELLCNRVLLSLTAMAAPRR